MYKVIDMVRDGQQVYFQFYRNGELYYKTESGFIFTVPISDCGDAVFNNQDKALLFMRWLRPALDLANLEQEKMEQVRKFNA